MQNLTGSITASSFVETGAIKIGLKKADTIGIEAPNGCLTENLPILREQGSCPRALLGVQGQSGEIMGGATRGFASEWKLTLLIIITRNDDGKNNK
jgi:hypothetical protein